MLDQLSRGRLEFGTGIGVAEHEFVRWNLPFYERRQMSQETLEIIIRTWTEDTVTYQGDYWQFDEALPLPKPYQSPIRRFGWQPTFRPRWSSPPKETSTYLRI